MGHSLFCLHEPHAFAAIQPQAAKPLSRSPSPQSTSNPYLDGTPLPELFGLPYALRGTSRASSPGPASTVSASSPTPPPPTHPLSPPPPSVPRGQSSKPSPRRLNPVTAGYVVKSVVPQQRPIKSWLPKISPSARNARTVRPPGRIEKPVGRAGLQSGGMQSLFKVNLFPNWGRVGNATAPLVIKEDIVDSLEAALKPVPPGVYRVFRCKW